MKTALTLGCQFIEDFVPRRLLRNSQGLRNRIQRDAHPLGIFLSTQVLSPLPDLLFRLRDVIRQRSPL